MKKWSSKLRSGMSTASKKAVQYWGHLAPAARKIGKGASSATKQAGETLKTTPFSVLVKSVGTKLFIINFLSIIVCVLTVGIIAYTQSKNLVEKNVSEASFQTVTQVTTNLDNVFKAYEDLTLQVLIDKDIMSNLNIIVKAENDFDALTANRLISDRLNNYVMGNRDIQGAALIPSNPGSPVISIGGNSGKRISDLVESPWFKATLEQGGKAFWIEPQEGGIIVSNNRESIAISRAIKTSYENEVFVLVMEINSNSIVNQFKDVQFGEGSTVSIVNGSGSYVVNEDFSVLGEPHLVQLPTEGKEAAQGSDKMETADGEAVLAAYQTSELSGWRFVATIPVKQLVKDADIIRNLTVLMVLIAAVIATGIGYLVVRTIAQPLRQLRNLMVEGSKGNLTVRSTLQERSDEIGELSDSFNEMMGQITALAKQTTKSAAEVLLTAHDLTDASKRTAIAAKEIAVATEEIANGATSLAVEAERGSDITTHMNDQMKSVIGANGQMAESAVEVEKASEQGTTYMSQLIQKTGMTEEMTRSMVEKVDALKDSTGSIVKILDVLNNLTKQTNILSLNATIEAARAGAAGKGFMVVADEIRKLADQSRQSIDVVGQITAKIQGEIEETVQVLSEAYPLFQEQISSVREANHIFLSVRGQMGQFVEKLELATQSINELNQSQIVLSDAMTSVSAVAEEASATSEEVASLSSEQLGISEGLVVLSEKLDSVSKGLQESLSRFKVE
ncbi:methyl-accepting chemotaxis protein [Paenibacillus sp. PL2-23]